MLRILLRRAGKRKWPFFQIVVCVCTKKKKWIFKDRVGFIKKTGPSRFMGLDVQKFSYWLFKGALFCKSLVKYFALYTRMHKFEWRTYSKNFKKNNEALLRKDLTNNLIWKWLVYKQKHQDKSRFKHIDDIFYETDIDTTIADFNTYIVWKYKKMRKYSNKFEDDVERYKSRLDKRKYFRLYLNEFYNRKRKQSRELFRRNTIKALISPFKGKSAVFFGKIRKRTHTSSFSRFLKKFKNKPVVKPTKYLYEVEWLFDRNKPVERYMFLMSSFIKKYTPFKESIFNNELKSTFFSNKNMKLLYIWKKNWHFFSDFFVNQKYLQNRFSLLSNFSNKGEKKIFTKNDYIHILRKIIKPITLSQQLQSSYLINNKKNIFNWFLKKTKQLNTLKFNHKYVNAFTSFMDGPYFYQKSISYKDHELEIKDAGVQLKDKWSKVNIANPLNVYKNALRQKKQINLYLEKAFTLNIVFNTNFFTQENFIKINNNHSYNKAVVTFFKANLKEAVTSGIKFNFAFKNILYKKNYIVYKKYFYENLIILNKYILLFKLTRIRLVEQEFVVSSKNLLVKTKPFFIKIKKDSFIINWMLNLKSNKFLKYIKNLNFNFFLFYFFRENKIKKNYVELLQETFWVQFFNKKLNSSVKSTYRFLNFINLKNTYLVLFNKVVLKFKRFPYTIAQKNNIIKTSNLFDANFIQVITFVRHKFLILLVFFKEINNINFFKKINEFVINLTQDNIFQELIIKGHIALKHELYETFLNMFQILTDLITHLHKICIYTNKDFFVNHLNKRVFAKETISEAKGIKTLSKVKNPFFIDSILYLRNFFFLNIRPRYFWPLKEEGVNFYIPHGKLKKKTDIRFKKFRRIKKKGILDLLWKKLNKKNTEKQIIYILNKLLKKYKFEFIWKKLYNKFKHQAHFMKDLKPYFTTSNKFRSFFKEFYMKKNNIINQKFIWKNKTTSKLYKIILSKFREFILFRENKIRYIKSIFKYWHIYIHLYSKYKKNLFSFNLFTHIGRYLKFTLKAYMKLDSLEIYKTRALNFQFYTNYKGLLLNVERAYNMFTDDNTLLSEKTINIYNENKLRSILDNYIWNYLLKNNSFFFQHRRKFLSIRGLLNFLKIFKLNLLKFNLKKGNYILLGKLFKMRFISIITLVKFLSVNSLMRKQLYQRLLQIRGNLNKNQKFIEDKKFNSKLVNIKWSTPLYFYKFM